MEELVHNYHDYKTSFKAKSSLDEYNQIREIVNDLFNSFETNQKQKSNAKSIRGRRKSIKKRETSKKYIEIIELPFTF